jgi:hypothetical protein
MAYILFISTGMPAAAYGLQQKMQGYKEPVIITSGFM